MRQWIRSNCGSGKTVVFRRSRHPASPLARCMWMCVLIGHVAGGDWAKALMVLNKVMPLSGILGRICDAPCQTTCNRAKVGEAIRIADLERACVDHAGRPRRVLPLPQKTSRWLWRAVASAA
ncbi:hypothetical protein [Desulfosarcina cetonica]|uniref:hypothetical protein n=1 Tax=Desulfosarcina cetonica TaxID=90730 RepID=UPI0009FACBDF|nr:hypothetical protein [Desulfosarcina cetonica]